MGNSNSVIDFEYKIVASDYKSIHKVKDPRLGELTQLKNNKSGRTVYMKEKLILDSEIYKTRIEEAVDRLTLKHRNLAKVYGFTGADSQEVFKNNKFKIYIYFEYIPENLQKAINTRRVPLGQRASNTKKPGNFFPESELMSIVSQLLDVLEYLQQNSTSHGEIKPEACLLSKEGIIKLLNRSLLYGEVSAFQLVKQGDRSIFLTPIGLEAIKKKQSEPIEDKYKADVFSLGLTILECATLKPSAHVYDWNNYTVNLNMLSARLLEVKDRYSTMFYELLREMLRVQESQRPDFLGLKDMVTDEGRVSLSSFYSQLPMVRTFNRILYIYYVRRRM